MQANNSIAKLKYINTLILGGSEVSAILRSKILSQIDSYYETYGMTETATHIAVKKISKNDQNIKQFSAETTYKIDLQNYSKGIYSLEIITETEVMVKNLILQ